MVSSSENRLVLLPVPHQIRTNRAMAIETDSVRFEPNPPVLFIKQFVKEVVDFSSQYGSSTSISYTAYNIAGKPSKFPDYGDFPQTFVMRTYGQWWDQAPSKRFDYMPQNNGPVVSHDYIDLMYHEEVYPVRISIYETYNPGSVVSILVKSEQGHWQRLWKGPPQIVPHKPRIFSPPLQQCKFKTNMIRIEFNHSLLDYYTELDAVLLIGTSDLIVPKNKMRICDLSNLLKELGGNEVNNKDLYNLTPNYSTLNCDVKELMRSLSKYCSPYKSSRSNPKKKLAKLSFHNRYVPPIEEALDSLQRFLQEDFPRLIKDMNVSSSEKLTDVESTENSTEKNTCGSFSVLPDEAVLRILNYLDLKSLNRVCQVNRFFNNIAQDSLLYTSLNLKPYWPCIDALVLDNLASKCQYLCKLDLSWCGNYDAISSDDFIAFLKSSGSSITHLRLSCCKFVKDSVLQQVASTCKNLEELCLQNCTNITKSGFSSLEGLTHLKRLNLYRTLIETDTLCMILKKNVQIRHLNLASMHERLNVDMIAETLAAFCPNLESIDFWKAQTFTVCGLKALSSCQNLKEVDFGWCSGIGVLGDSLRVFLSSCKNLQKVFLTAFHGLTDKDLKPLFVCKNLQQLDLVGARNLSPEFCSKLLSNCWQLRMIDLSFCEAISDNAILEWRKMYPNTSIKRDFHLIDNEWNF